MVGLADGVPCDWCSVRAMALNCRKRTMSSNTWAKTAKRAPRTSRAHSVEP